MRWMSCPWLFLVCVRVCFVGGFGFGSSLVAALELVLASARGASDRLSGDRYRWIACVLVAWAIGVEQVRVSSLLGLWCVPCCGPRSVLLALLPVIQLQLQEG